MPLEKVPQRPEVFVSALTANTVEVVIELVESTVRIIADNNGVYVDAKGTKVRIKP